MVGTRDIPSGFAAEAIITGQSVLKGDGETMADVEVAVGVGRRHDDGITILSVVFVAVDDGRLRLEGPGLLPESVNVWLELSRFVTLCKTHVTIIA